MRANETGLEMPIICWHYKKDAMLWFRIFGCGLCFRNLDKYPKNFSERNGYSKGLSIGKICITTLNK